MADVNLTRTKGKHKVKRIDAFDCVLDVTDEVPTSADDYQLMVFPPKTLIKSMTTIIEIPNDAVTSAVADIGIDGGSELASAFDLTGAAGAATTAEAIWLETGGILTFTPTYTGAMTEGKMRLHIEYAELGKTNGAFTRFLPL